MLCERGPSGYGSAPARNPRHDPIRPSQRSQGAIAAPAAVIHAAFFYQPGCDECERSEHDLQYIQEKYPQVEIRRLNIKEEAALNQYLCQKAGVPEDKHLTAPALFVGVATCWAIRCGHKASRPYSRPMSQPGAPGPGPVGRRNRAAAEQTIAARFRSFGLLTVVGAGLLDGVNPCAFATIIFLISYLTAYERKRWEILATGLAFTLGVFLDLSRRGVWVAQVRGQPPLSQCHRQVDLWP